MARLTPGHYETDTRLAPSYYETVPVAATSSPVSAFYKEPQRSVKSRHV